MIRSNGLDAVSADAIGFVFASCGEIPQKIVPPSIFLSHISSAVVGEILARDSYPRWRASDPPVGDFGMRSLAVSCVAALALAAVPNVSRAQHLLPFDGTLDATTTSETVTNNGLLHLIGTVAGHGTVLGNITGSFDYYVNPTTGDFAGVLTKIGSNGDEVHELFAGQFNATFTASVGIFFINGGTGKYKHAAGGGFFKGTVMSAATIDIDYDGLILLP
jgi:hypothetical protein